MKILFITTQNPHKQGDLLEISILNGLRKVLGNDCIDFPRKKIMYHDFSETRKDSLHGRGFSLLTTQIEDIPVDLRSINKDSKFDAIIYGDGHMYGERVRIPQMDILAFHNSWVIDGHDLYGNARNMTEYNGEYVIGVQFYKTFKRELLTDPDQSGKIFPTGFGIPEERILEFNFGIKDQIFQSTAPDFSMFRDVNDLGGGFKHHRFTDEKEYYHDLSRSWFGLSCKKGGWDCLRHYEIIASGSLLLIRDLDKKPKYCSPQGIPALSYSSIEELNDIINGLLPNGVPTQEYFDVIEVQRKWLYEFGTTEARAKYIIQTIQNEKDANN